MSNDEFWKVIWKFLTLTSRVILIGWCAWHWSQMTEVERALFVLAM